MGPDFYPDYSRLPMGFVLLFAPCVVVPIIAYYAFTYKDVKRIETPKKTQVIIASTASLPTFIGAILIGTSFKGPISLLLWDTALLLNLFPFSTIVLLSLYYLLRAPLAGKTRQQEAHEQSGIPCSITSVHRDTRRL